MATVIGVVIAVGSFILVQLLRNRKYRKEWEKQQREMVQDVQQMAASGGVPPGMVEWVPPLPPEPPAPPPVPPEMPMVAEMSMMAEMPAIPPMPPVPPKPPMMPEWGTATTEEPPAGLTERISEALESKHAAIDELSAKARGYSTTDVLDEDDILD